MSPANASRIIGGHGHFAPKLFERRKMAKTIVISDRQEGKLVVRDYYGQAQVVRLNATGLTDETFWIHSEADIHPEWPGEIRAAALKGLLDWRASQQAAREEKERLSMVEIRPCGDLEVEVVSQDHDTRHELFVEGAFVTLVSPERAGTVTNDLRALFTKGREVTFSPILRDYKVAGWLIVSEVRNILDYGGCGIKRRLLIGIARKENAPGQFGEVWFTVERGLEPKFYGYRQSLVDGRISHQTVVGGTSDGIYIHVEG